MVSASWNRVSRSVMMWWWLYISPQPLSLLLLLLFFFFGNRNLSTEWDLATLFKLETCFGVVIVVFINKANALLCMWSWIWKNVITFKLFFESQPVARQSSGWNVVKIGQKFFLFYFYFFSVLLGFESQAVARPISDWNVVKIGATGFIWILASCWVLNRIL